MLSRQGLLQLSWSRAAGPGCRRSPENTHLHLISAGHFPDARWAGHRPAGNWESMPVAPPSATGRPALWILAARQPPPQPAPLGQAGGTAQWGRAMCWPDARALVKAHGRSQPEVRACCRRPAAACVSDSLTPASVQRPFSRFLVTAWAAQSRLGPGVATRLYRG